MERYSEYKDSGVKWLGKIPSHWEICRFKNFASLITTPSKDSHKIGLENIESASGKFHQSDSEFEGNGVQFQENDIVYGKLRPYLQKVWLATFSGNAVGDFFVFRTNKKISEKYLQYLMLSKSFTDDVNGSTYGAKMPRVSSEYILTMRCTLPSKSEQNAIVFYLDSVTARIDEAIAQQQKMIDLLNERKQIIINKAVTKGLDPNVKMKPSGIDWIGDIPKHWMVVPIKRFIDVRDGTHDTPSYIPQSKNAYPLVTSKDFIDGKICFNDVKWISYNDFIEINRRSHVSKYDVLTSMIGGNIGKSG